MYVDSFFGEILEPKDFKIGEKVKWDKKRDIHIKGMRNTPMHICLVDDLIVTKIGRRYIGVSHIGNEKIYMIDPFIIKKTNKI